MSTVDPGNPLSQWSETGATARPARIRLFDARLPFLATLVLAPLYAIVDVAQQFTPGPNTAFSSFFKLPAALHALAFIGIYLGVWFAWYVALLMARGERRQSLVARLTEVHAARTLLNVYLAVVLGVSALVALRHGFSLGLAVQTLLLLFTYAYAELAWHAEQPH